MSLETQIEKLNANLEALLALAKAGASAQVVTDNVTATEKTAQQAADALFGQFAGGEPSPAGRVTETAPKAEKAAKPKAEKEAPKQAKATPSKEDAQKAVLALVKAKGRDAAVKVLSDGFNAENLSAVPADKYADVIAACEKAAA